MKSTLKLVREEQGLSLRKLGDLCGRSGAQMHCLESDDANPTLKTAYAIASVLGESVYYLWPDKTKIVTETSTVRRVTGCKEGEK